MTALRVRPEADHATDTIADYYAREAGVDVALRFLEAIDQAYTRLLEHPCTITSQRSVGTAYTWPDAAGW